MARIILKSPYYKPNTVKNMSGYLRYIATRDGVERPEDSKRFMDSTATQKDIIKSLLRQYPDSREFYEYEDYLKKPNRENADEYIMRTAETYGELFGSRQKYVRYIATRPRAERLSDNGLFSDDGKPIVLADAMREVENHTGNIWTHIISLRREDAERLGYGSVDAWMTLLRSQRNKIAQEITIYGSIAQSESENISANVIWGKTQSAKEGNVAFQYKRMLGYRRGEDGKPEIVPEQAKIVKTIFTRFLAGGSFGSIAQYLNEQGIPTVTGKGLWTYSTIQSILKNEKYKGDALLNKTYTVDCLTKKVKVNNGERPKYYVENNHPAIIEPAIFNRVQEELARRAGKRKVKQVGTTTEQGKYCGKYELTELLLCGECGTPYRRCTWTVQEKKRAVWRCINRLDYGKKYCKESASIEESGYCQ